MCTDVDCPVTDDPPPGEGWCQYRLGLEYARWVFGYPMAAGEPGPVTLARLVGLEGLDALASGRGL